ncbi:MAG TPA: restriction endonuclease subunit S [Fimbriimonadaceae bacterium]|nr:restriction endonuclease subunit S [Fimbriimonadaceae bacterium]
MKTDWPTRALKDVCLIGPPKAEARNRLSPTAEVSFLPMEGLGIGEKFVAPTLTRKLDDVVKSYTYFADGDVLLAKITPCFENGKLGIARDLAGGAGFGSSEFIVLRPREAVMAEYLYYFLSRELFRREGASHMTGAVGHKRVTKDFIENYPVPVPPLDVQAKVVASLDEALTIRIAVASTTEGSSNRAQRVFDVALAKVFENRNADWHEHRLADLCTLINGRAYKKHEMLKSGKYPLLRVGNFFTNKAWYYSDLELEPDKYCDTGDLLYAWSASFGPRIWEGGKVIYHYHIWKVIPNPEMVDKRFLFYLLQWDVDQIKKAHGTGATMMHVSKASMEGRVLPVPPLSEQRGIVTLLDQLEGETTTLVDIYAKKRRALDSLREALLGSAFRGSLGEVA